MLRKIIIALFAVAALGLVSPSIAFAAGGRAGSSFHGGGHVGGGFHGVASVTADFAEADLAVLVFMGHMPTADTAILTAMAATTTTAAAIWFVSA
jgi:hypothetical protein